jgi:hypothetical protein
MTQKTLEVLVPREIEAEVDILVQEMRNAAEKTGNFQPGEVKLIRPQYVQATGTELLDGAVLYVAGHAVEWVVKPWFDEYVLPVVMERIKKPSKAFKHWFENTFKRS